MAKLGSFDWAAKKKAFVFFGEHSKYVPRNVGMTQGRDPGEAPSHVINPVPPSALGPTVEVVHGHLLTSIRHAKPGQSGIEHRTLASLELHNIPSNIYPISQHHSTTERRQ